MCFKGATWTDAKLDLHWAEIVALLSEDWLIFPDLSGRDLHGICLHEYTLVGFDLSGADLSNAKLSGTNFTGSNLQQVDFTDAWFGQTYFQDADSTGAIITDEQLARAGLCRTVLPDRQISYEDCPRFQLTSTP